MSYEDYAFAGAPVAQHRMNAEDEGWQSEYEKWQQSRLDRVQTSARSWLGLLTGLLGLLGSVVLLKGGDLVTDVTSNRAFQVTLIVLVALVFAGMVCAVVLGGVATWGGLKVQGHDSEPPVPEDSPKSWLQWKTPVFVKWLAFTSKTERTGDAVPQEHWQAYKDSVINGAESRRIFLHASRTVGVVSAGLIALLVIVAVIAGTVSPTPTDVVVVHGGRMSCGSVAAGTGEHGVTQVVPVTSC
jgi:hypothetical protein